MINIDKLKYIIKKYQLNRVVLSENDFSSIIKELGYKGAIADYLPIISKAEISYCKYYSDCQNINLKDDHIIISRDMSIQLHIDKVDKYMKMKAFW